MQHDALATQVQPPQLPRPGLRSGGLSLPGYFDRPRAIRISSGAPVPMYSAVEVADLPEAEDTK